MNPKYKQLENEDSYEYGLRLIETKIEQNPPDLEWSDIVDLLGLDIHYDSLRKAANVTPYCGYRVMKYLRRSTQEIPVKSHILESWIRRCLSSKKNAKDFSIKEQHSTR